MTITWVEQIQKELDITNETLLQTQTEVINLRDMLRLAQETISNLNIINAELKRQLAECEGWQLVPRNLTPEQRELLLRADEFTVDEMWIMLLAAAPKQEEKLK